MGYSYEFKTKEIKLRRDTPLHVIEFLDKYINNGRHDYVIPQHDLFKQERCLSLFNHFAWYDDKPYFKVVNNKHYVLFLHSDIKYGREEIIAFCDWIAPYVIGHKPKEYIGWYRGDEDNKPTNLYIERK